MRKADRERRFQAESEAALDAENLRLQREAEAEAKKMHEAHLREQEESQRLAPYLGGLPYDRDRLIQSGRFIQKRTYEDALEFGKILIALKEKEGYGDFVKILENEFEIAHTTAYRFMSLVRKSESFPKLGKLIASKEKGLSKLFPLLEVSDEELQEFEKSGEIRNITVDEIELMSRKELAGKLRSEKKKNERGRQQLQEMEAKIKEREEQLAKKEPLFSSEEERDIAFLQEAQRTFWQAIALAKRVNPEAGLKARYELYSLLHLFAKITEEEAFQIMQAFPDVTAGVMMDLDTGKWETEDRNPFPEVRKALKKLRGEGDGDNGAQGTRS